MKKCLKGLILIATMALISIMVTFGGQVWAGEKIKLTFTSWRSDDIQGMDKVLAIYNNNHPDVIVEFQPKADTEYDAQLMSSLQTGTGADIIFLRSFSSGKAIYDGGFLHVLNNDIPSLKNFPSSAKAAWSTDDGKTYGIPIFGVTHGVYYHKNIFKKYNLKVPETWDEFMAVCKILKQNHENVFAQGAMDEWTLYEVVFSGLGPNFYGGEKSRQALIAGKMKLTDPAFVDAFEHIDMLQPFLPRGYQGLDYVSMQQMFAANRAAMFFGGSWEIGTFRAIGSNDIGWFPPPVRHKGDKLSYCFHVDAGIGLNKNSKHYKQALEFVQWTATPEYAQLVMNQVPGFYAYTPGKFTMTDELAKTMLNAAQGADITIRTTWEKLSDKTPSGNSLMNEALIKMLTDKFTPKQAAAFVQKGLETWYKPFQQ
jgi:raffinose/stachyose/melibiose transport system substrate-binding protein